MTILESPSPNGSPCQTTAKPRILVVEDDDLCRRVTLQQLQEGGYEADSSATAYLALESLRRRHWDVILSDYRLPGMDGLRLLAQVRQHCPRVQLILMSAYGTRQTVTEAQRLGAMAYLTKPFDFRQLEEILEGWRCAGGARPGRW